MTEINYALQTTQIYATTIISNSFTDGIAKLEYGYLHNIVPLTLHDAVNKLYVDNYISSTSLMNPNGPIQSIQYNNNGEFNGLSDFIINSNLLSGKFSDGIATWNSNLIYNLEDPIEKSQIATKNYVDSFSNIKITNIYDNNNMTYTANDCINGIINRYSYENTLIDLTPSATDFINNMKMEQTKFSIKCISPTSTNTSIIIVPNLGISIYNTLSSTSTNTSSKQLYIELYTNYIINFTVLITSTSTISTDNNVNFLITSINYLQEYNNISTNTNMSVTNQFDILSASSYFTNILAVESNYISYFVPTYINSDTNSIYSIESILNKYIIRSGLTSNRTDSITNIFNFYSIVPLIFQPNDININKPTGICFYVLNNDPIYSITINMTNNGWLGDPILGTNPIISPSKTAILNLCFINNVGYIYLIGII